jgi:hypothetical protein
MQEGIDKDIRHFHETAYCYKNESYIISIAFKSDNYKDKADHKNTL